MRSQRGLCPPGPKMPPESELQKPDVSALTGFQERSGVSQKPPFPASHPQPGPLWRKAGGFHPLPTRCALPWGLLQVQSSLQEL